MTNPNELQLTEAAAKLEEHKLSASDLVSSCLAQIERFDNQVQAWETVCRIQALGKASEIDDELVKSKPKSLLHGIPIGIKDVFLTAGIQTTAGSPTVFRDFIPQEDATVVAKLRDVGAIILGKTVTTELAYLDPARTRNPWNLEHTPGGSSSGSAAAVAARMCFAALGTQTVGSTIRPAAYCGIVGLKPTYGRVSRYGVIPLAKGLDHVGIFARSVQDVAAVLEVIAGYDPNDEASSPQPVPEYLMALNRPLSRPVLGLLEGEFLTGANECVRNLTEFFVKQLEDNGAQITRIKLPTRLEQVHQAMATKLAFEAARAITMVAKNRGEPSGSQIRGLVERGSKISYDEYRRAEIFRKNFRQEVLDLFTRVEFFLALATPTPAPRGLSSTGDPTFIAPWTFIGLPQITIPIGISPDGLPCGIQIIGPDFCEDSLLACAKWCESIVNFDAKPPLAKL